MFFGIFSPKSSHGRRKLLPLKQLCIPATLKLDILKYFHEQGSSHKSAEALFETIRHFFGFIYTQILCCIVGNVRSILWLRKEHTRIKRNCIVWNHVGFFYKILADISSPFKMNSAGNRYCLMVLRV